MTPGRLYAASFVAISLLVAVCISWPAFLLTAALWLLIAVALLLSERAELKWIAADAVDAAAKAVAMAETFADEAQATHAANEILCAELAAADEQRRRLSNELLAAHLALSDAEGATVVPFPTQRDGAHDDLAALDAEATTYTWPAIARDIEQDEWTALMRAVEED